MGYTLKSVSAGIITLLIFSLICAFRKDAGPETMAMTQSGNAQAGRSVAMPAQLTGVLITLGLKDQKPTDWKGTLTVSAGKLLALDVAQGNPKAAVKGATFNVRTIFLQMKPKKNVLQKPVLRLTLDAPASARVRVTTQHGGFEFVLGDLPANSPQLFMGGQATVQREEAAFRITGGAPLTLPSPPGGGGRGKGEGGGDVENDYPALARAADGSLWLAYSAYHKGQPYVKERVLAGNFDDLVPRNNGDQVRLKHFDGSTWGPALEVTGPGLDIWRPTVTVAKGRVHVSWSQQVAGNWDVYHRVYMPRQGRDEGRWSDTLRVTTNPATDYQVTSVTDASGHVWLAWLAWDRGFFQVHARKLDVRAADSKVVLLGNELVVTRTQANHWSPTLAADARGKVYVAYDGYDRDNYDVHVAEIAGGSTQVIPVAASARFEARPSIACDRHDRLWIAYEEGDEQWGKDFANQAFRKIALQLNPGKGLYLKRTIQVKCLVDGKGMQPAGDLQEAIAEQTPNNRSVPRLGLDSSGGLWLLYRHHPRPLGAGEVWNSFAVRYAGQQWSPPRRLAQSDNLMDNRPVLAPWGQGILAVFSGDGRTKQQDRKRNDLFAAFLLPSGADAAPGAPVLASPVLVAEGPPPQAQLKTVHPNEAADIARMRAYRLEYQGQKLRLLRGEFHRHTEYTAHRDGDGLLEDSWRYALDAGRLDWMGNADHDNGYHDEYSWWQIQKMADVMHNAPAFVALQSYERSVPYPNGHRNVILPRRGIRPLPRGVLAGTEENGSPDAKLLYRYLKHFGGMCSSHTSATDMGTDWRDNDPVYEPVVEVYQGHRHNYEHFGAPRSPTAQTQIGGYEPKGFIWNAFDKGYKLGFQASSDHISTHMSYGIVLTADISRQGIIDAFKRRHSYAATDNIILEFRCGRHMMGDIFEVALPPAFVIKIVGTAPVTRVSIVRDSKYLHMEEPNKKEVTLTFTDREAIRGKTSYYYVRLEQSDGNLAWASPMWITYKK